VVDTLPQPPQGIFFLHDWRGGGLLM